MRMRTSPHRQEIYTHVQCVFLTSLRTVYVASVHVRMYRKQVISRGRAARACIACMRIVERIARALTCCIMHAGRRRRPRRRIGGS